MKNVYPFITSNANLQDTMLFLGAVVTQTCSISLVCPSNCCALFLQCYCFISWLSRAKDPKLKYFFIGITKIVIFFSHQLLSFYQNTLKLKDTRKDLLSRLYVNTTTTIPKQFSVRFSQTRIANYVFNALPHLSNQVN